MKVDHLSLTTTPVNLYKGDVLVSQGTGFYYVRAHEGGQALFLVTNFHVLTGSSPAEKKPPIGDNISFQFHESDEETGKVRTIKFPLFTKDQKPVWITSQAYPDADLAIIPILPTLFKDCKMICISADWAKKQMKVRPTTNVTLVGYPYGYYDATNALPVWKTGTIASEPDIDFDGKPLVLIDVSAFPGMSGSPVFAVSAGMYEMAEGGNVTPGVVRQFVGIYASMQMIGKDKFLEQIIHGAKLGIKDYESLQIGHVWKADLILETVKSVDIQYYENEILKKLQ